MASLRQRNVAPSAAAVSVNTVELDDSSSSSSDDESLPVFNPPNLSVKDLLSCIPSECYQRSALRSGSYIVMDVAMLAVIVYAATFINPALGKNGYLLSGVLGSIARTLAWGVYAFVAALPGTGIWVIAHECGHQSFSDSKQINNTVGWVLHSALLVPYHSWRISHAKHHAATGHMTRDQVFVPKTRSQRGVPSRTELAKQKVKDTYEAADDLFEDAPIWVLANVVAQQLFGWPAYLIRNASGQKNLGRRTNHFEPESPIFDAKHRDQIIMSDIGVGLTLAALYYWATQRSFAEVALYYIAPYLWVNSNLVMITFLQHTDPQLAHYREGEWNFQRGALCTIDRSLFGFFFHGICETHVAHHSASKIPHYNAWKATEALKERLGEHYRYSPENPYITLFKNYRDCRFVEDEGDILMYKNSKGKAAYRVATEQPDSGIDCSL